MFRSATVKLTTWYLIILVVISLLFSVVIYSISSTEVRTRISYLQKSMRTGFSSNQTAYNILRDLQVHEAEVNLLNSLAITNVTIWIAGGVGSYYLARRTLRPIEEAHEAQSRFTSDASHELRTPLASMKTELEVALRDPSLSPDEVHELLTSNLEEVNKLTKLSETLLQLSRLDHENLKREKIRLDILARSAMERFGKAGKRIQLNDTAKTKTITANKPSVEELLTILIDNALKYSPPKSRIIITMIKHKQMAGFEIANEGAGIAADVLPHIFDRFYRADTSRTGGEKKGYGLGLSLAKKIVEIHSGELTVSSGPKQPTTFRVLLPRVNK